MIRNIEESILVPVSVIGFRQAKNVVVCENTAEFTVSMEVCQRGKNVIKETKLVPFMIEAPSHRRNADIR